MTSRPSSRSSPASRRQLAQILQAPPSGLEHQDQPIHKHRRGIAPIAPRTRQISIRQPAEAEPMVELGQQRQAPMGREGLVCPFQLEG